MATTKSILLHGGTILFHTTDDNIEPLYDTDILIEGDIIKKIGKNLPRDSATRTIHCTEKIISPGFVDTHHHCWQTQLRGRHSDDSLLQYHPKGNLQFYNYTPEDIFWGELGGLMEAVDGGTTCIVDHAHHSRSPDHVFAGISATIASRIRSVFCYSLVPNIKKWDEEFELESSPIPEWFYPTFDRVTNILKDTKGRVSPGLGTDNFFLPEQNVKALYGAARKNGAKVITSHWRRNNLAADDSFSIPKILKGYELLGPDILLSHGTGSTAEEFKILKEAGAYISSTPATESQMAHGDIVAFEDEVLGSLGADCQSNNPGSMLHQMQTGLAVVRALNNSSILSKGKFPKQIEPRTQQAFNLATICGARAIGMEGRIGSIKEGKQADLVVFDASGPSMVCAADENPLVAVTRHASPGDVEVVIVGGEVLKEGGKLVDVMCDGILAREGEGKSNVDEKGRSISWKEVSKELRRSRGEIRKRIEKCKLAPAEQAVLKIWGVADPGKVLV